MQILDDPKTARKLIREGKITTHTSSMCPGFIQANLVILQEKHKDEFLEFARLNKKAVPVLEVGKTGCKGLEFLCSDVDICKDIPKYRVFKCGEFAGEFTDVSGFWQNDFVSVLIGCSFTFEHELTKAGVPLRHIEEGKNVSMYKTNIPLIPFGKFGGNMVVSMRPVKKEDIKKVVKITKKFPHAHGEPIHIGNGEAIGIRDLQKVDFGDPVSIKEGEVPVFWACGVSGEIAVLGAKLDIVITHSPGHMLICDIKNEDYLKIPANHLTSSFSIKDTSLKNM